MNWSQVRKQFPNHWVLVEAIAAHSEGARRIVDEIAVISSHDNSEAAMHRYLSLHKESLERELYVVHTSRKELDISERKWLGVRIAA